MSDPEHVGDIIRRMVGVKSPEPDPHRGGCNWHRRDTPPEDLSWFQLLDWAVYHAPGWREWQEFRRGLVGTPMDERAERIRLRWELHQEPEFDLLAHTVRIVNLLRSLRGQFSADPRLRSLLAEVTPELEKGRERLRGARTG